MRRKEYSMQVKQLRFPPQKIKVGNGSMEERHAEGRWSRSETASDSKEEARKSVVTKGKRTMRVGNGSFRDLVEAHERLLKVPIGAARDANAHPDEAFCPGNQKAKTQGAKARAAEQGV